jgi:hypothetical protein
VVEFDPPGLRATFRGQPRCGNALTCGPGVGVVLCGGTRMDPNRLGTDQFLAVHQQNRPLHLTTTFHSDTSPARRHSHIWSSACSAGYNAYLWSEVIDDAYERFNEHGE